jgi:hypothetical protein
MGDENPDRFVGIPLTERGEPALNRREHPDLTLAHVVTYLAVRSCIATHPASEGYSRWTMSVPEIAKRAGLHRGTVIEALEWLEAKSYLYAHKNGRRPTTYTVVLRRDRFLEIRGRQNQAEAMDDYEGWIADQSAEARAELAEERRGRRHLNGKRFPPSDASQKSPGGDIETVERSPVHNSKTSPDFESMSSPGDVSMSSPSPGGDPLLRSPDQDLSREPVTFQSQPSGSPYGSRAPKAGTDTKSGACRTQS